MSHSSDTAEFAIIKLVIFTSYFGHNFTDIGRKTGLKYL